jgi:hypothetical protein
MSPSSAVWRRSARTRLAGVDRFSQQYLGREYGQRDRRRYNAWIEIQRRHGWAVSRTTTRQCLTSDGAPGPRAETGDHAASLNHGLAGRPMTGDRLAPLSSVKAPARRTRVHGRALPDLRW